MSNNSHYSNKINLVIRVIIVIIIIIFIIVIQFEKKVNRHRVINTQNAQCKMTGLS